MGEDKVASFDRLVAGEASFEQRLIGRFAVLGRCCRARHAMLAPSVFSYCSPVFFAMRIPIESGDASDQNRSAGGEQLDDGIVDTLVSALLLMSACHEGCRVSSQANEEISDKIP